MKRFLLTLLLLPLAVSAGIYVKVAVGPANLVDTANRSGAASGTTDPSGFTCIGKGDGAGSIDGVSATQWDFSVSASGPTGKYLCYQDAGAGDAEALGEIQNDYAPTSLNVNASIEVGLTEGTGASDYQFVCYSPLSSGTGFKVAYGIPGSLTLVDGPAGTSRPGYCAVTYDLSSTTLKGFYCPAGATPTSCVEIASTTRSMSDVLWYLGGKSFSATNPLSGTVTDIDFNTTISVYTPSDPPADPVWNTEVPEQTLASGGAWSYDFTQHVTCVDTPCTYSATGFPGSSGLSVTSAGAGTGTANANDLAGSPFNVTVTVTNNSAVDADEVFLFTVNPTQGACTGTTFQFDSGDSTATINAQAVSPGDCVSLNKGDTWQVAGTSSRLQLKSGITYTAHGTGANPIIDCGAVALNFLGCVEIEAKSNVSILHWTIRDVDDVNGYLLKNNNSSNTYFEDLLIHDSIAGCFASINATDVTIDDVEVHTCIGGPHESIAMVNVNGFDIANSYAHGNGHAAVNIKNESKNGRVHDSIFETTTNDPTCYIERGENIEFDNNICRNTSTSTTFKPLLNLGLEPLGTCESRFTRNVEIHHNLFHDWTGGTNTGPVGMWIKFNATDGCGAAEPALLFDDIHWHHNTIVVSNPNAQSSQTAFRLKDARVPAQLGDWSQIVFECNLVWDTGVAKGVLLADGLTLTTNRNNLYLTGESFTPSNASGTNPVFTSNPLFTNMAGADFTLQAGSPALNACFDGSNIGAF